MHSNQLTEEGGLDPAGRAVVDQLFEDKVIASAWYGESTESTNSLALAQAQSNHSFQCPRLILTDKQTAGRGRRGRTWLSSDQTLTFSLVLDRPSELKGVNLLSLAVGVGIARCLEFDFAPLRVSLKWPNDVYVGGGKVAGILLETARSIDRNLIVGVGFNVGSPPEIDDSSQAAHVCSLNQATGRSLNRYDCFAALVKNLLSTLQETNMVVSEFKDRCMLSGQQIRFQERGVDRQGRCLGIDEQGELIVELETETKTLRSGEVQMVRQRNK